MTQTWTAGPYKGDLTGWEVSSASTGTPCMMLHFQVGEHQKDVPLWLSPNAIESSERQMIRLGWNLDYEKPNFTGGKDTDLRLKYETYKGKQQERWELGFALAPAKPDVLAQLTARARAVHGPAKPAPAGKPAPPPTAAKAPPPAAPAADPGLAKVADKQGAWEFWVEKRGGVKPAEADWLKAVDAVGPDEDKFGVAEWRAVAAKGSIPI